MLKGKYLLPNEEVLEATEVICKWLSDGWLDFVSGMDITLTICFQVQKQQAYYEKGYVQLTE